MGFCHVGSAVCISFIQYVIWRQRRNVGNKSTPWKTHSNHRTLFASSPSVQYDPKRRREVFTAVIINVFLNIGTEIALLSTKLTIAFQSRKKY